MGECRNCGRKLKDPNAMYGWRCAEKLGVSEKYTDLPLPAQDAMIHAAHLTEEKLNGMGIAIEDDPRLFTGVMLQDMHDGMFRVLHRDQRAMGLEILNQAELLAAKATGLSPSVPNPKLDDRTFYIHFKDYDKDNALDVALENLSKMYINPTKSGTRTANERIMQNRMITEISVWLLREFTPEKLMQKEYASIKDLRQLYDKIFYMYKRVRDLKMHTENTFPAFVHRGILSALETAYGFCPQRRRK